MTETRSQVPWQVGAGDMPPEEFRAYAHQLVDWISDYLENVETFPVLSQVTPGDVRRALPASAPDRPETMKTVFEDFDRIIMPGVTHWNHPAFFAYFAVTGSAPGILGEMLAAALNINGMLWRTSPASTELEEVTLDWLRQWMGLPVVFKGVIYDTASISTLVALAAAREAVNQDVRQRGMSGRDDLPRLVVYCSQQAHSSVEKAAITLGLGKDSVRQIVVDDRFRMNPAELRRTIETDVAAGHRPICAVATVGTTSTTSVDPVGAIADICESFRMWLHVDAAYGGAAAILPEMRWIFKGAEHADSLVVNPHKWLFTPVDLSAFYSRRLDTVRAAFSLVPPAYLQTPEGDEVRNFMDYGPQLGRRFRSLKLWFVLRSYGRQGIEVRLREHMRLAQMFAAWVEGDRDWELMAPVPFSTVCFRACPRGMPDDQRDDFNADLLERVNASGKAFLSSTQLRGRLTLRLAIGNLRTAEQHVRAAWQLLRDEYANAPESGLRPKA